MANVEDADSLAEILTWLKDHPEVQAAFGGPEHVTGLVEAPWPHLRVHPTPGIWTGDLRWLIRSEVTLEAVGHPDGRPGQSELRRLLLLAARCARELVDREVTPTQTVITEIDTSASLTWSPLPGGQPRWVLALKTGAHPAPQ